MYVRPLIVAAIAFCSPALAQTELNLFHAYASHSPWQEQVAATYATAHPDVTFRFQAPATTYDEALVSVIRQSLSDQQPDVFFVGSHLLNELVARDLVQPMDDLLAGMDLPAMGYAPETLALGQVDGKQYALPWTSSTPVVFFNVDLVRQAGGDPDNMPTDWDGMIALAQKITALGPDIMGMYWELGTDDWMTQNLLRSANVPLMDEARTEVAFDTPEGLAAITLFQRFHTEGGQQPIEQTAARQQFYAGQMGLYFVSTAAVRSFGREVGDRFAWDTSPIPTLGEGGGVVSGGMAAAILTDDPERRKAAFDYILHGTGADSQALIVQNTGYMPVNTGALTEPLLGKFYAQNPAWETSVGQIGRAAPWFAWPGQNSVRIGQTVLDTMTSLANAQITPEEAQETMVTEIGALLP